MSLAGEEMKLKNCDIFTSAQQAYWIREFGFEVYSPNFPAVKRLIQENRRPIVEIADGIGEYEHLPKNSITALLNTDEKYNFELFKSIIECDAFVGVIRQYKINEMRNFRLPGVYFFGILQSMRILEISTLRKTVRWLIEGIRMKNRQLKISKLSENTKKCIVEIPLGYTDYFAETYISKISLRQSSQNFDQKSLLEIAQLDFQFLNSTKTHHFVFIGQVGQIVRRQAIEALKKFESKVLILRDGYGGVGNEENRSLRIGEEYVNGVISSKISVCPPGNISGNSYRIMESLICGAYPAVMGNVLCDPLFESPVIEVMAIKKPRTWTGYLKKLELVTDAQLQACVMENITKFKSEIQEAKAKLLDLQKPN